jgi:hypothetical protein
MSSHGVTCRPRATVFGPDSICSQSMVHASHGPVYPVPVDVDGRSRPRGQSLALALQNNAGSRCRSNRGLDELALAKYQLSMPGAFASGAADRVKATVQGVASSDGGDHDSGHGARCELLSTRVFGMRSGGRPRGLVRPYPILPRLIRVSVSYLLARSLGKDTTVWRM